MKSFLIWFTLHTSLLPLRPWKGNWVNVSRVTMQKKVSHKLVIALLSPEKREDMTSLQQDAVALEQHHPTEMADGSSSVKCDESDEVFFVFVNARL